jgi:hypothetical protein
LPVEVNVKSPHRPTSPAVRSRTVVDPGGGPQRIFLVTTSVSIRQKETLSLVATVRLGRMDRPELIDGETSKCQWVWWMPDELPGPFLHDPAADVTLEGAPAK